MDGWSHVGLLDDIDMSSGLFYGDMIYGGYLVIPYRSQTVMHDTIYVVMRG